jgi:hypothetical protein
VVCAHMVTVRLFLWGLGCFYMWFSGLEESQLLFFCVAGDVQVCIGSLPPCFP